MCEADFGPFDSVEEDFMEDAQGRLYMDMNEEDKQLLRAIRDSAALILLKFYPSFSTYARMFWLNQLGDESESFFLIHLQVRKMKCGSS